MPVRWFNFSVRGNMHAATATPNKTQQYYRNRFAVIFIGIIIGIISAESGLFDLLGEPRRVYQKALLASMLEPLPLLGEVGVRCITLRCVALRCVSVRLGVNPPD